MTRCFSFLIKEKMFQMFCLTFVIMPIERPTIFWSNLDDIYKKNVKKYQVRHKNGQILLFFSRPSKIKLESSFFLKWKFIFPNCRYENTKKLVLSKKWQKLSKYLLALVNILWGDLFHNRVQRNGVQSTKLYKSYLSKLLGWIWLFQGYRFNKFFRSKIFIEYVQVIFEAILSYRGQK